ncbi:MAG: hypothetical protein P4L69_08490 [Desulfosporosinus sp.]|nr:hypothetical protein [Desulfosporosinus sp.]
MSSDEESPYSSDDVIDLGSEDSTDEDYNSEEDYYIDDETGERVSPDEIRDKDKEAFEMLHSIIYGSGNQDSRRKRFAHDLGLDEEEGKSPAKKKKRPSPKAKSTVKKAD